MYGGAAGADYAMLDESLTQMKASKDQSASFYGKGSTGILA
jgi:hypothetical protein